MYNNKTLLLLLNYQETSALKTESVKGRGGMFAATIAGGDLTALKAAPCCH